MAARRSSGTGGGSYPPGAPVVIDEAELALAALTEVGPLTDPAGGV